MKNIRLANTRAPKAKVLAEPEAESKIEPEGDLEPKANVEPEADESDEREFITVVVNTIAGMFAVGGALLTTLLIQPLYPKNLSYYYNSTSKY